MQFLTQDLRDKLLANGRQQQPVRGTEAEIDFMPRGKALHAESI